MTASHDADDDDGDDSAGIDVGQVCDWLQTFTSSMNSNSHAWLLRKQQPQSQHSPAQCGGNIVVQSVLCAILIVPVKELVQEIDHYLSSGHSRRGSGIDKQRQEFGVFGVRVHWRISTVSISIYIFVTHIRPIPLISNVTQECAEVTCSSLQRRGASNDDVPGAGPCWKLILQKYARLFQKYLWCSVLVLRLF